MYEHRTLEAALGAVGDLDIDLVGLVSEGELVSAQPLPPGLAGAISDVADLHGLNAKKWMNSEPTSLLRHGLPDGFLERCARREFGGLTVLFADRYDQIHLKLFAIGRPNDKHHLDLQRLRPTPEELLAAARWTRTHASGEGFEMELRAILATFGLEVKDD